MKHLSDSIYEAISYSTITATELKSTDKAIFLEIKYITKSAKSGADIKTMKSWFPKKCVINNNDGTYNIQDWVLNQAVDKLNENRPRYMKVTPNWDISYVNPENIQARKESEAALKQAEKEAAAIRKANQKEIKDKRDRTFRWLNNITRIQEDWYLCKRLISMSEEEKQETIKYAELIGVTIKNIDKCIDAVKTYMSAVKSNVSLGGSCNRLEKLPAETRAKYYLAELIWMCTDIESNFSEIDHRRVFIVNVIGYGVVNDLYPASVWKNNVSKLVEWENIYLKTTPYFFIEHEGTDHEAIAETPGGEELALGVDYGQSKASDDLIKVLKANMKF